MTTTGKMKPEQIRSIIEELEQRYQYLHPKIDQRIQHFHNRPEVDPILPEPFNDGPKYQTTLPLQIWRDLRSRMQENHFTINITPLQSDSAAARKTSNALEHYFNEGFGLLEERMGAGLQGLLADGQIIHCYGVLHWHKAEHGWPESPELDFLEADAETIPDGYSAVYGDNKDSTNPYKLDDNLRPIPDPNNKGFYEKLPVAGYRETAKARDKRYADSCAESGFVWQVEVPLANQCMFVFDNTVLPQPAMAVVRRVVPLLTWIDKLNEERKASLNELNKDIPVYGEVDAPAPANSAWAATEMNYPSGTTYRTTITVYSFWTRDEYYEIANGYGFDFEVVKSGPHEYDVCPFALCYAQKINSPEPLYAFEPALEGVFRLKPTVDFWMTHKLVMAQQIALPFYYWENTGTGRPMLDEKGVMVTFDQNSANAEVAPEGYKLAKMDFNLNEAFIEAGRDIRADMQAAAPPTGQAEFTTSTQPWAIRLQQQQANVYPGSLVGSQGLALLAMTRNMLHVHSKNAADGGWDQTYVYALRKNGQVDPDNVLSITPEDVKSLKVAVTIASQSGAERITLEEHGRTLYQAGLITLEKYYEDYLINENPDEAVLELKATKFYEQYAEPQIAIGALTTAFAKVFTFSPQGQILDWKGQPALPQDVLAANGMQAMQAGVPQQGQPPQGGPQPGGRMAPQAEPPRTNNPATSQTQMPGLSPLAGQGQAMTLPGMHG